MITNRTLTTWRREALTTRKELDRFDCIAEFTKERRTMAERIIRLTQELQDIDLLKVIK